MKGKLAKIIFSILAVIGLLFFVMNMIIGEWAGAILSAIGFSGFLSMIFEWMPTEE